MNILHISDMQFGKHHAFPQEREVAASNFDTLLERVAEDLRGLLKNDDLDLILCTGDLTEWAWPLEFKQAFSFLADLGGKFKVPKDKIVVIPGNHDVHREECRRYFNHCYEAGENIVAPWFPKWKAYVTAFNDFYSSTPAIVFDPGQPWTLYVIEELKTIVAGFNSTWIEGHNWGDGCYPENLSAEKRPRHAGWCGEEQLSWFAEKLKKSEYRDWLKIGAIHHNLERGIRADNENLLDVEDFERIVGPYLHTVFHGHTHNASFGWRRDLFPWFGTGSAGLKSISRAEGVPNQYQIADISGGYITVRARMYLEDKRIWQDDPRMFGRDTDRPLQVKIARDGRAAEAVPEITIGDSVVSMPVEEERDLLLEQVIDCCQLRYPEAKIRKIHNCAQGITYLLVKYYVDGLIRHIPVACSGLNAVADGLEQFYKSVFSQYRSNDASAICDFVTSTSFGRDLRSKWYRVGVRLFSLTEYRGLIDFREYRERQSLHLDKDEAYPPSLYVNQRMEFELGLEKGETENALEQMVGWLQEAEPRFVLVLGDFGTGKTFLLKQLARKLGGEDGMPTPLLIELRGLEKARRLDELLAQHFARHDFSRFDLRALRFMIREGRVVLIFDGFDELALRVGYAKAAEHLDTIVEAAQGNARVVVSCRTSYFENDKQVRVALGRQVEAIRGLRWCRMQKFDQNQIKAFLQNRFQSTVVAGRWYDLLDKVKDLLGLGENPRMLSFICKLQESQLQDAAGEKTQVSAAKLYEVLILQFWLDYEHKREHPKGASPLLLPEELLVPVELLALKLWSRTERWVSTEEMSDAVRVVLARTNPDKLSQEKEIVHYLGKGTLFVRDDEGRFTFVHHSVLEWLIARYAVSELKNGRILSDLLNSHLSSLMAEFMTTMDTEVVAEWSFNQAMMGGNVGSIALKNALRIMERLRYDERRPISIPGADLRGEDLTKLNFKNANLRGCNLTNAVLSDIACDYADFEGAIFTNAVFDGCSFTGANLTKIRAVNASGILASFDDANMEGSTWRSTRLVGASGLSMAEVAEMWGCSTLDLKRLRPRFNMSRGEISRISINPDGRLLAIGYTDGFVSLVLSRQGIVLSRWKAHVGTINALAWSPDGVYVASAGADKRVCIRDVGMEREVYCEGHEAAVYSLAWTRLGGELASGGSDSCIRFWSPSTGRTVRPPFFEHNGTVYSIDWSDDGQFLLSGGADRRAFLWSLNERDPIARFSAEGIVKAVFITQLSEYLICSSSCAVIWREKDRQETLFHAAEVTEYGYNRESGHLYAALDVGVIEFNTKSGEMVDTVVASALQMDVNTQEEMICLLPNGAIAAYNAQGKQISVLSSKRVDFSISWTTLGQLEIQSKNCTEQWHFEGEWNVFRKYDSESTKNSDEKVKTSQKGKRDQDHGRSFNLNWKKGLINASVIIDEGVVVRGYDGKIMLTIPINGACESLCWRPDGLLMAAIVDGACVYLWDMSQVLERLEGGFSLWDLGRRTPLRAPVAGIICVDDDHGLAYRFSSVKDASSEELIGICGVAKHEEIVAVSGLTAFRAQEIRRYFPNFVKAATI